MANIDEIMAQHKARLDQQIRPLPSTREAMAEGLGFWLMLAPWLIGGGTLYWVFTVVMEAKERVG